MRERVERLIAPFDAPSVAMARHFIDARPWASRIDASSLLTPNGAPIEATYTSDATELRLTVEPARVADSATAKWQAITEIAPGLEHPLLVQIRRASEQRYGAWLSLRLRRGVAAYKVYQELREVGRFGGPSLTPTMVGYDGELEYYGLVRDPRPRELHELAARAGVARLLPTFLDALGYFGGRSRARLFDEVRCGVGIREKSVTFYAPVRQLFASDTDARVRVLALARMLGQPLFGYEAATAQGMGAHGMLGFRLAADNVRCSIGVAP